MSTRTGRRPGATRHGFTLAELMISIMLFGMIMAVVIQVIARQQRFHRGASAVVEMRGQMRHATHALPVDLRAIFPAGGDISSWSSSSIGFRAFSGSSVLCAKPAANTIVLPPLTLTQGNRLTAWINQPVVGDSIIVLDENWLTGTSDDVWQAYEITAVASVTGVSACPVTTNFTVVGDAATPSWQLGISPALSSTIVVGAPIRIFRQVSYELYEAADGRWYLGMSDCLPGRTPECSDLTAISGPFRALDLDPAQSGLQLTYFDAAGTELDPAVDDVTDVARIEVVVRAATSTPFSTTKSTGEYADSLTFVIGLRNRD